MTSKVLVAFDPARPDRPSSDFLVPVISDGELNLYATSSKRPARYGMVIYVGQEVSANDLFAKLVDSGRKVLAVEEALALISAYVDKVNSLRIGQVVEIAQNDIKTALSFRLAEYPKPVRKKRLP